MKWGGAMQARASGQGVARELCTTAPAPPSSAAHVVRAWGWAMPWLLLLALPVVVRAPWSRRGARVGHAAVVRTTDSYLFCADRMRASGHLPDHKHRRSHERDGAAAAVHMQAGPAGTPPSMLDTTTACLFNPTRSTRGAATTQLLV